VSNKATQEKANMPINCHTRPQAKAPLSTARALLFGLLSGLLSAFLTLTSAASLANPGTAADASQSPTAASPANAEALSEGVIKKLDIQTRKITLQHGPIDNLGMSAMTMGFRVAPGVNLEGFAPGDAVQFRAIEADRNYVITTLKKRP
jgi:Cu/Ag efflux protein CusF